jgi:putative ABC transport system substrate-binding protein
MTPPVVGFLNSGSSADSYYVNLLDGFRKGLAEVGYFQGQSVVIEFRWADGRYDLLPGMAADLASKRVAVISAGGPSAARAAKAATQTIPIIFTVGDDPVKLGLVASLNQPGGNATGVNLLIDEMESKRFGMLLLLVPKSASIAVLLNPHYPGAETEAADLKVSAQTLGRQIHLLHASSESEIDKAFATMVELGVGGLLVGSDPYFQTRRDQFIALAARHAIPTIYNDRAFAANGGLISYGVSVADGYHQAGIYVGRILKGERPSDLPVIRQSRFGLFINLKTARSLQVDIPSGLLAIADEAFE